MHHDDGDETDDPVGAAKAAGLRYVTDTGPGIRRVRDGDHFAYLGVDGQPISDPDELVRIASLGIPPAWTDVWISPLPNGHLQATGHDARRRKQYRYHPRWRAIRDETKFHRMIEFGEALPRIRARVRADLARPGLHREKVVATVVQLLDETAIRIGNEEYVRENDSYGLTTLEHEHVAVRGATLHFEFKGKGGKEYRVDVRDPRVARIVKQCQDLPGHELFQYLDDHGHRHSIESNDVNSYLHETTGERYTAKDFRTWHGTVVAAHTLRGFEVDVSAISAAEAKHNVAQAIKAAAEHLGNTPAICRKSYVYPAVIDAYLDGSLARLLASEAEPPDAGDPGGLNPVEREVLALLRCLNDQKRRDGARGAA